MSIEDTVSKISNSVDENLEKKKQLKQEDEATSEQIEESQDHLEGLRSQLSENTESGAYDSLMESENLDASIGYDGDNEVVSGTGETDDVRVRGDTNRVSTGAGDDLVDIGGEANLVRTGSGEDIVNLEGDANKVRTGSGRDFVDSNGDQNNIETGSGDDVLASLGHNNKIKTGTGEDLIDNNGDGNTIRTQSGDDSVLSTGDNNTLKLGRGDDYAAVYGDNNMIKTGAGSDNIFVEGKDNVVKAGSGSDFISVGADSDGTEIQAGSGSDEIYIERQNGGEINIIGGVGQDTLTLEGNESEFELSVNADTGDKIYTHIETGSIINVAADVENIEFFQPADIPDLTTTAMGEEEDAPIDPGDPIPDPPDATTLAVGEEEDAPIDPGDPIPDPPDATTLAVGEEDDSMPPAAYPDVINYEDNQNISTGSGDQIIYSIGHQNNINSGSGSDIIVSGGDNNSIVAGSGNDVINSTGVNNNIDAGSGDDEITLRNIEEGTTEVSGGSGNDILYIEGNEADFDVSINAQTGDREYRHRETGALIRVEENVETVEFYQAPDFGDITTMADGEEDDWTAIQTNATADTYVPDPVFQFGPNSDVNEILQEQLLLVGASSSGQELPPELLEQLALMGVNVNNE